MAIDEEGKKIHPFWCAFTDAKQEELFRQFRLPANREDIQYAMVVPILVILLFAGSDFMFLGWSSMFTNVMMFRIFYALITMAMIFIINRIQDVFVFDLLIVAWALMTDVFSISISLSRPPDYYHYLMMDILVLVFVYTIFPFRIALKIPTVLAMTAMEIWAVYTYKDPMPPGIAYATFASFGAVNLLGLVSARRANILERMDFLRLQSEMSLKNDLEEALFKQEELVSKLKESDAMKTRLFTIIGSDLHQTFRDMLHLAHDVPNDLSLFEEIEKKLSSSIRKSDELIENLLIWSQLQTETFVYKAEVLDVFETLNLISDEYQGELRSKNQRLRMLGTGTLPVVFDGEILRILLKNLISNAIKFSPANGEIVINAQKDGLHAKITVRDSGPGIGQDQIEAFHQGEFPGNSLLKGSSGGTGLGLLLCNQLVQLQRGRLELTNLPGGGLEAEILLPQG